MLGSGTKNPEKRFHTDAIAAPAMVATYEPHHHHPPHHHHHHHHHHISTTTNTIIIISSLITIKNRNCRHGIELIAATVSNRIDGRCIRLIIRQLLSWLK
jgi:hypothetical protein